MIEFVNGGMKMKRIRVAGIIFIDGKLAVMHRKDVLKRPEMPEYYTLPGGGLEEGETTEEGTKREVKEEFGIDIKIVKKLYEFTSDKFDQKEIFYLCEYVAGTFGTGQGPEFSGDPKYIESGKYLPELIEIENIGKINLMPPEIKNKIVEDIQNKNIQI